MRKEKEKKQNHERGRDKGIQYRSLLPTDTNGSLQYRVFWPAFSTAQAVPGAQPVLTGGSGPVLIRISLVVAYIMEGSRRLALPPTPLNPAEPLPLGPNALESGRSAGRGEKRRIRKRRENAIAYERTWHLNTRGGLGSLGFAGSLHRLWFEFRSACWAAKR